MAPDEEYQLTPAGRRERIGQIVRLIKKYRVWDNLTPVRLRRLPEELGPMFVKMGQILANRSEILPQRFCDELRRLRSDVEPVPYEVVLRCLDSQQIDKIDLSRSICPLWQGPPFCVISDLQRSAQSFPACQWLSLWESWLRSRLRGLLLL